MDELFFPGRKSDPSEPQGSVHLDPLLERRLEQESWKVRSARWRAWSLAELAFGEGVRVSLAGQSGYDVFRGILNLSVPFRDMEDHRLRERVFLSWAGQDPVLSRVPMVYIFQPDPAATV